MSSQVGGSNASTKTSRDREAGAGLDTVCVSMIADLMVFKCSLLSKGTKRYVTRMLPPNWTTGVGMPTWYIILFGQSFSMLYLILAPEALGLSCRVSYLHWEQYAKAYRIPFER